MIVLLFFVLVSLRKYHVINMKELFGQIQIKVNEGIFIKDPNSSDLGKKIITEAISDD